ncbi:MAG TPA: ComF family protein [Candidatus Avamphibacillus sp.]|nr:ComF family protein [Candidatus Avamphibacillus sp.]
MNCLWCDEEIIIQISWLNLVIPPKQQHLCNICMNKLDKITGKRCKRCSRRSEETICIDCKRYGQIETDPLVFNYSVYSYNEYMQEIVTKWKYRGDYILGRAFEQSFQQAFKEIFPRSYEYCIIPVPLSRERLKERAFNQAAILAGFLTSEPLHALTRVHGEKQSKKTRKERMSAVNPFKSIKQLNKPAILVDDIYTTGTTLRHAAQKLKQAGCPDVYGFTLIRG